MTYDGITYDEIDTGYFTQLIKEHNLEYVGRSKEGKGWEGIYKDKNGQLYAIIYGDYMGGQVDVLYLIDAMPELIVKNS